MKVEHHVTIHSGLNIHAPVFAESMEEAERLGREWALAQFAASGYDPEWLQLQAEVVTPRPEQLIRARSEERRVGKECRCRGWQDRYKGERSMTCDRCVGNAKLRTETGWKCDCRSHRQI